VQRWPAFRETNPQLKKLVKKFQTGLISNVDDKLLGQTRGTSRTTSTSS
jgi:2-haloacid dehalogenase/putative hydrolase of the HAD superfamily